MLKRALHALRSHAHGSGPRGVSSAIKERHGGRDNVVSVMKGGAVLGRMEDKKIVHLYGTLQSNCRGNCWWLSMKLIQKDAKLVSHGNPLMLMGKACSKMLSLAIWLLMLYCVLVGAILGG